MLKHIYLCLLLTLPRFSLAQPPANNLAGIWKNDEQPVWIEIVQQNDNLTGTFSRVEHHPDLEGKVMLQDFTKTGDTWKGEIFAVRLGEFKAATLQVKHPEHLTISVKVGFMQRTVSWTRVSND